MAAPQSQRSPALPPGYVIDTPTQAGPWADYQQQGGTPPADAPPTGGLPADFTIDQPDSTTAGLAKAFGTGVVKGGISLAGLPVSVANAVRKAYAGYNNIPYDPATDDYQTGTAGDIQNRVENRFGPLHQPNGDAEAWVQSAGEIAPALIGGPETLAAKLLTRVAVPYAASKAAGAATAGTPYDDLASLAAGAVAGGAAMKYTRGRALDAADNAPVSSSQLAADGAHPAAVSQVRTLENLQREARASDAPTNAALRDNVSALLQDPTQAAQFSPATTAALQDFADDSGGLPASIGNTNAGNGSVWGLPMYGTLALSHMPVIGVPAVATIAAAKGGAIALRKLANVSANNALERIKTGISKEPQPAAAAPVAPTLTAGNAPIPSPWGARPPQPSVPTVPLAPQQPTSSPWGQRPPQPSVPTVPLAQQPAPSAVPPNAQALATNAATTQAALRAAQNQAPATPVTPPAVAASAPPAPSTAPVSPLAVVAKLTKKPDGTITETPQQPNPADPVMMIKAASSLGRKLTPSVDAAAEQPDPVSASALGAVRAGNVLRKLSAPNEEPTFTAAPSDASGGVAEVPVPDGLFHTKVGPADLAIAKQATDQLKQAGPIPSVVAARYFDSTANRQARIRDRLMALSGDPTFPSDDISLGTALDKVRHVRSREALDAHVADITANVSPQVGAVIKSYLGPDWAKSVWNPSKTKAR